MPHRRHRGVDREPVDRRAQSRSPPRNKRIPQTLSACRRAGYVASSSLGIPEQSGAAHRHEHVEHEHDMHGSMVGRLR